MLYSAHLELASTKNDPLLHIQLRFFGSLMQGNDASERSLALGIELNRLVVMMIAETVVTSILDKAMNKE